MYKTTIIQKLIAIAIFFMMLGVEQLPAWKSLSEEMTYGGDDRIIIPQGKSVNKYFTAPIFDPSIIARSSCTSSCLSPSGLDAVQALYNKFTKFESVESPDFKDCFNNVMNGIRQRIKDLWGTDTSYVITTPSGSDAEMIPTLAALGRSKGVTNIVVANGEVGSGTTLAAELKHFSKLSPSGNQVEVEALVDNALVDSINLVTFTIRDHKGDLMPVNELEGFIRDACDQAINQLGNTVVLHMVHASKTGISVPREAFVKEMKKEYRNKLIVVVDAAQARMELGVSQQWLTQGFWVLVTGSKFFAGPSFSGALLIPEDDANLLAAIPAHSIAIGFNDYFTQADCEPLFENLKTVFGNWCNTGLALRWHAALAEAYNFYNDEQRNDKIVEWVNKVRSLVDSSQHLKCITSTDHANEAFAKHIGNINSIISFAVYFSKKQRLNIDQLKSVHSLMTKNLTSYFSDVQLSQEDYEAAKAICLIGQPVKLGTDFAVLRIAIGAPGICALDLKDSSKDEIVIRKLDFIVNNWNRFLNK